MLTGSGRRGLSRSGSRWNRRGRNITLQKHKTILPVQFFYIRVFGIFPMLHAIHLCHKIHRFVDRPLEQPILIPGIGIRRLWLLRIKEVAIAFIAERMHVTIAALPLDEEIDRGALAITLHLWYDDRRGEEHDDRGARE